MHRQCFEADDRETGESGLQKPATAATQAFSPGDPG